jgi:hypothetical protein
MDVTDKTDRNIKHTCRAYSVYSAHVESISSKCVVNATVSRIRLLIVLYRRR